MKSYVDKYPTPEQRITANLRLLVHCLFRLHRSTKGYNAEGELILIHCATCGKRFLN